MNKMLLMIVMLLCSTFCWSAEDPEWDAYIALAGGSWEIQEQTESSASVAMGVEWHQAAGAELEVTQVDDLLQYNFRLMCPLYSIGNHSLTMQVGYAYADYDMAGDSYTDSFFTYGLGYQWRISQSVRMRYMHNVYDVDEFGDTGVQIGNVQEDQVSLAFLF